MDKNTQEITSQLQEAGYDYGVAIATQAEIEAKSACGMLSIITDSEQEQE